MGFDLLVGRVNDTLAVDFEHIKMLCLIAEMYVYLGDTAFLVLNGKALGTFSNAIIAKVRPAGACWVYSVCEALLRAFPGQGAELFLRNGVFSAMLQSCAAYVAQPTDSEPDRVISLYLNCIARTVFSSSLVMH